VVRSSGVLDGVGPVTGAGAGRGSRPSRRPAPDPADQARQWAEQTASSQGLPVRVSDPAVLRKVAVLLGVGREPDIRGGAHGARSELTRSDEDDSEGSSLSAWWRTIEICEQVGPVEVLRGDDGRGAIYGARCESCSGAAVVGWQRDAGAVALAAVVHGEQVHGGETAFTASRSPEDADAVGIENVAALDRRGDGEVVDQGGDDGPLTGGAKACPLAPERLAVADETF